MLELFYLLQQHALWGPNFSWLQQLTKWMLTIWWKIRNKMKQTNKKHTIITAYSISSTKLSTLCDLGHIDFSSPIIMTMKSLYIYNVWRATKLLKSVSFDALYQRELSISKVLLLKMLWKYLAWKYCFVRSVYDLISGFSFNACLEKLEDREPTVLS